MYVYFFLKQKSIYNFRIKQEKQDYTQHESSFPGITLKFCVSDVGLEALLKCPRLRKISIYNSHKNPFFLMITYDISHWGAKKVLH